MARLAGRADPPPRGPRPAALARRAGALRAGGPARHGRLEPGPGGAPTLVRRGCLPRPGHDAPGRDPPPVRVARPRPHALRRVVQVGRDDRDALAPRLLLGPDGPRRDAVRGGD